MCWSMPASVLMIVAGSAATGIAVWRREPAAIPMTIGYFTVMEALQAAGYWVIDDCGGSANRFITLLSYLHIVFQPFFINAFAMQLIPIAVQQKVKRPVYLACGVSAVVMLMQLYPFSWAGTCEVGQALCDSPLCLVSGEWHLAWNIPYNNLLGPLDNLLGTHLSFPTYLLTVFLMPIAYGAWRFVLFHAFAGPVLALQLTANPNEWPAVWCLFSIGILLIGTSPWVRRGFGISDWFLWPKSWRVPYRPA